MLYVYDIRMGFNILRRVVNFSDEFFAWIFVHGLYGGYIKDGDFPCY